MEPDNNLRMIYFVLRCGTKKEKKKITKALGKLIRGIQINNPIVQTQAAVKIRRVFEKMRDRKREE